jgi:hypothetical protein
LNDLAAELAQTVDLYASFGAFGQADKPEFLCKGNYVPQNNNVFITFRIIGDRVDKALVDF